MIEADYSSSAANRRGQGPRLVAAMVTPFDAQTGAVDKNSAARLAFWLQSEGVDDFFVLGSTGELPFLDEPERLTLIESTKAATNGGTILYAGISGTGVRQAIRNAESAHRAGADVAVLMCPFFLALSQEQLADYCLTVADKIPCPLVVYHHLRMPTPFSPDTVARLAEHPNIIGIKDTNGADHDRCAEILQALPENRRHQNGPEAFHFFQGVEKLVLPSLQAGAHGCVVAQACIAPTLFRRLLDAWVEGDLPKAEAAQIEINALWQIFSQPETRQSFFHFLRTLKLPLQQRGVIASAACSQPQLSFPPEFDQHLSTFFEKHLSASGLASVR